MSDLNKWVGSGRVTRDTELRYTPNGTAVADVGLCSNRQWSKDGERQEEPTFLDITLWGKQAEALSEYLTKGTFVMVEGRLSLDTWKTEEGVNRSKLRVVAEKVNLGPRSSGSSGSTKSKSNQTEEIQEEVPF
jgi:single-strand DNA-binding protein|tara:strand:+ start:675 stop:1073 length:399 start_codon:yes stop_codon:yes gene_type:complete